MPVLLINWPAQRRIHAPALFCGEAL